MRRKPALEAVNRYGLRFGRARKWNTYRSSGRYFASYYTLVCLRCGRSFRPPAHTRHRLEDCDDVRADAKRDAEIRAYLDRNLYGAGQ